MYPLLVQQQILGNMQTLLTNAQQAKRSRQGDAIRALWSEIEQATYSASQFNAETQAGIAKIALAGCVLHMHYFNDNHIHGAVTDTIVKFVRSKEVLNLLSQDDNASRTLAFCCLCTAADTATGLRDASNIPIVEMLMAWSDKNIETEDWFTVEDLITLLYGPAVYPLFRPDVESDRQLTVLLYEQKTALLGVIPERCTSKVPSTVPLPDDMSIDSV